MRIIVALLCLMLTGCAGMIFSHKPYQLHDGTVVEASPRKVLTEWRPERQFWCGPGNTDLCIGDFVYHLSSETVPVVGTAFHVVDLTWDKQRKCWRWESR